MTDPQRDIGALEARQNATDARLKRIEEKVDRLIESMAMAKGGMRMLLSVGAIAATLGGGIAELVHWMHRP